MKTKSLVTTLLAGLFLAAITVPLHADETNSTAAVSNREQIRQRLLNLPPEERRALIQELRAARASENAGQPPDSVAEERRAKLQQKLDELHRKDGDGTITPEEQKQLDRLEMALKQAQPPGPRNEPGERPRIQRPFPGGPQAGQPGPFIPRFDRVLTEEQRASLREVMASEREKVRDLEEKLRVARKETMQLSVAPKFDEDALRQKALEVGRLEAEMTVSRARTLSRVNPPLSPEQIERLRNAPLLEGGSPRPEFPRAIQPRPLRGPRDQRDLPPPPKPEN